MISKRSESFSLVLKPLKLEQKRVPYAVFDASSISLQYYLDFDFDSGALANSFTTRRITKSYEVPIDPNYPTLQNSRNKIYRGVKKFQKTFSTFPND